LAVVRILLLLALLEVVAHQVLEVERILVMVAGTAAVAADFVPMLALAVAVALAGIQVLVVLVALE
jgi:hypothetical protein